MQNPIQRTGWFKTPKSTDELIDICKNMKDASEAQRVMIFTMNFCHMLVQQEIDASRRIRVISKGHNGVHDPEADAEEQFGRAGL